MTAENQQIRDEIHKVREEIKVVGDLIGDEFYLISLAQKRLKKAKTGIKNMFAHDEDSYIEIILPYSMF